jgi:hypothetical protein
MTDKKTYVCIRCAGVKDACTLHSSRRMLPLTCGPDGQGYIVACDWLEVPEKVETKQPR